MTRTPEPTRLRRGRGDDAGALTIALIFMMVGSVLLMLVTAAIVQEIRKTSNDRSFTAALPTADAGIQDALNRLNRGLSIPLSGSAPLTGVTQQATGAATFSWYADKDTVPSSTPQSYTVHSTTTINGVSRTVHVQLFQDQQFKYALFADSGIGFNGNNTATSYPAAGAGQLATNGSIRLNGGGGSTSAESCLLFGSTQSSVTSRAPTAGCGSGAQWGGSTVDIASPAATQFIADQLNACQSSLPAGQTLQPYVGAELSPGTYCFSSINLGKRAHPLLHGTPANPVRIFVAGDINADIKTWLNYDATTVTPDASSLQIFSNGANVSILGGSVVAGAVWAPKASCYGGAQVTIDGSLVCGSINNVGGWTFRYDQRLLGVGGGGWKFRHYTEYR